MAKERGLVKKGVAKGTAMWLVVCRLFCCKTEACRVFV